MDDSSRHTQRDSKKKRKSSKQHYRDDESRDGGDSRAGSLSTDGDGRSVESSFDEQRRLRKSLRKAKRIAKHLEDLRLEEEEGDELDNFSLAKYPVREFKFTIPGMSDELALNPVVTLIGVVVLWSVVLWCTANPTNAVAKLDEWRTAISLNFTWLIQGTKVLYLVVALFVMCKYGHVKLGAKDEKPEFSTLAYACMIYTVGVSNSLYVFGVAEPLSHQSDHFFAKTGYRSQDEIDLFAITMTVTDWGPGGWAVVTVVGVALSLAAYRFKLPMSYRSIFYPILGHYTWGWMGDLIDGFAVVAGLAGMFTALGMAAVNFVAGFAYMGWIDLEGSEGQVAAIQSSIIWVLSTISLASAISGLHGGIQKSCILAVALGSLLMLLVFAMDDTKYLLNLQVQELGTYLQSSVLQLNFWTDAFGQLRDGSGRAVDGKAAEQWWYLYWMNFGQTWWVATSAVFGQFVARISRGRRIWEVCFHSLVGPFLYTLVWFCIWGGIGLRHSRQAMELERLGESLSNSTAHFVHDGNEFCYDVPQEDILVDGEVVFTNHLPGVTPVCMFDAENPHSAIFNVLNSFSFPNNFGQGGGFGSSLSVLLLLGSAVFFMAGAGAASTIIDKIASSGRKNNHLARRMFWLITAAALATALLSTGGEAVLTAVQAAMIICGLPFSILLCYALQCMMQMCRQAAEHQGERDYRFPTQPEFSMPVYGGIFNVLEYCASLGKVAQSRLDRGMGNTTSFHVMEAAKGLLVPFLALRQVLLFTHPQNPKTNFALVVGYAITYVSWIGLCFASLRWTAWAGVAWTFCIVHGIALAFVRSAFRTRFNIRSNTLADVISSTLFWPQVLIQMHQHCLECSAASTKGLKPEACREIEIEI